MKHILQTLNNLSNSLFYLTLERAWVHDLMEQSEKCIMHLSKKLYSQSSGQAVNYANASSKLRQIPSTAASVRTAADDVFDDVVGEYEDELTLSSMSCGSMQRHLVRRNLQRLRVQCRAAVSKTEIIPAVRPLQASFVDKVHR